MKLFFSYPDPEPQTLLSVSWVSAAYRVHQAAL